MENKNHLILLGAILVALFSFSAYSINPLLDGVAWFLKPPIYACVDSLCAYFFIKFFPPKIALPQAVLLLAATLINTLLLVDLASGMDLVYTEYENLIRLLTKLQFLFLVLYGMDDIDGVGPRSRGVWDLNHSDSSTN